jgi:hypothetical protein
MAVIEASLEGSTGFAGGGDHLLSLGEISTERFFAENVFAGFEAGDRNWREGGIESRHDHRIYVRSVDEPPPIAQRFGGELPGQLARPGRVKVRNRDDSMACVPCHRRAAPPD